MEKGQLRCDCNISVRPEEQQELGAKIEIKNMNSISGVRRALAYEVRRQTEALERGEKLEQETRGWDDAAGETFLMRTKEFAHDYRYFADPDLVPVQTEALVDEARARLPELPRAKRARFVEQYGVSAYDAGVLANDLALAELFRDGRERRAQAEERRELDFERSAKRARRMDGRTIADCPIAPAALDELVNLIDDGKISGKQAKEVFAEMFASGKTRGGNRAGKRDRAIERHSRDRSALRSGDRGESEAGGGFQSGKPCFAEFSERAGDEAFAGKGESRAGGRDFGAKTDSVAVCAHSCLSSRTA